MAIANAQIHRGAFHTTQCQSQQVIPRANILSRNVRQDHQIMLLAVYCPSDSILSRANHASVHSSYADALLTSQSSSRGQRRLYMFHKDQQCRSICSTLTKDASSGGRLCPSMEIRANHSIDIIESLLPNGKLCLVSNSLPQSGWPAMFCSFLTLNGRSSSSKISIPKDLLTADSERGAIPLGGYLGSYQVLQNIDYMSQAWTATSRDSLPVFCRSTSDSFKVPNHLDSTNDKIKFGMLIVGLFLVSTENSRSRILHEDESGWEEHRGR